MPTSIWWIRRDLRLSDNQALTAAVDSADTVIPLFILDPRLLHSSYAGEKRIAFLFDGLRALDEDLRGRGSRLIVRRGDPIEVLLALIDETGAAAVFAEEDISPFARRRDNRAAEALPLQLTAGIMVYPPELVLKEDGDPYVVFTPFSKTWKALHQPGQSDLLAAPHALHTPPDLHSLAIPAEPRLPAKFAFPAGEAHARQRSHDFTAGDDAPVYAYDQERNRPDLDSTSRLSPHLRFGMISLRQAVVAAYQAIAAAPDQEGRRGAGTWLNELIWREFYLNILYHFPRVRQGSFRPKYDDIVWHNGEQDFQAWCQGRTGYPLVDAAMRQLSQSGWMHNRTRMITASFLVKDLLVDWRWGERYFMQHLLDGDPASNNGGWQWTAGTGTDAAPYFRIFNPISQNKKFDPQGDYIRRWLPELADVPQKYIHEPWQMPDEIQAEAGCRIGDNYPAPIVDHKAARERTLAAYKEVSDN